MSTYNKTETQAVLRRALGVSASAFHRHVRLGRLPQPISGVFPGPVRKKPTLIDAPRWDTAAVFRAANRHDLLDQIA